MRVPSLLAATAVGLALALTSVAPAHAGPADRQIACSALGGTLSGNGANQVCTVISTVVVADVPSGEPSVSYSADRPVGDAVTVDTSPPVRQPDPSVAIDERDAGEATVERTERPGTPVVTEEERDAAPSTSEDVVVLGTPSSTDRTVLGASTTTQAPTTIDCRQVNDARAARPVERCERAVLTTVTTPTTVVTTTTTSRELVTTTTQPRETLITTTTPWTEVFTTTQPRQSCTTTTYATLIDTETTQQTERTRTTTQPTTTTTTVTTAVYGFPRGTDVPTFTSSSDAVTTAAGTPEVTEAVVPGTPVVTTGLRAGADEADVECDPIAPIVTAVDGATRQQAETAVEAADAIVTVTSATIDPLVVDTEAPGAPVVTTSVEGIGETCMATPAVAEQRRNRC
ncbi:hypothetical protein [Agrococcus sp. BE272]|uniref:hypothetical protein n=1 Tax=Agrococcus sp. BE272 TaxID=2817727 RepID=UPI00286274F0|nr:hypothetical protein [Agrococcus sp. BE272]MDR7234502.1 hypothetical protein [Agrococcus sp. BE272]